MKKRFGAHLWAIANPRSTASLRSSPFIPWSATIRAKGFCKALSECRPKGFVRLPPKIPQYAIARGFSSSNTSFARCQHCPTWRPATTSSEDVNKTACANITMKRRPTPSFAYEISPKSMHTKSRRKPRVIFRRHRSSTSASQSNGKPTVNNSKAPQANLSPPTFDEKVAESTTDHAGAHNYFQLPHMPKMPHRPTKDEILAAATGFWSRLRVRFKWFSIRSVRPFNIDDWSAFVSWLVLGHIVWILVGTTTFFSILIFAINTVVAQGKSWIFSQVRAVLIIV